MEIRHYQVHVPTTTSGTHELRDEIYGYLLRPIKGSQKHQPLGCQPPCPRGDRGLSIPKLFFRSNFSTSSNATLCSHDSYSEDRLTTHLLTTATASTCTADTTARR